MPYIWIYLVVFFGVQDDIFSVAAVTICVWMLMWGNEELRTMEERVIALSRSIACMGVDELRGEVKP